MASVTAPVMMHLRETLLKNCCKSSGRCVCHVYAPAIRLGSIAGGYRNGTIGLPQAHDDADPDAPVQARNGARCAGSGRQRFQLNRMSVRSIDAPFWNVMISCE